MSVYLPGATFGSGYGGNTFGLSPYGGVYNPRSPVAVNRGYGGYSYSYSSYGHFGYIVPKISYAISTTGFVIRVFFTAAIEETADVTDINNYDFTTIEGVDVTVLNVDIVYVDDNGVLILDVTHTGTTLGGQYHLTINNLVSAGTYFDIEPPNNEITLYTLGDLTSVDITLQSPEDLLLSFTDSLNRPQELLTEGEFTPGVNNINSYEIVSEYPFDPVILKALQDTIDLSKVVLEVKYLTSTLYDVVVGPSFVYNYDGSVLPEDDPQFTSTKIGTGTAMATSSGLFLSKDSSNIFGYSFGDNTGRLLPNSSYRVDFTFDLSSADINPPVLSKTFGTFTVSDGVVEITILLRDISDVKVLEVVSGSYSTQIPYDWSVGQTELSLLRNQRAGIFSILLDDYPQLSFKTTLADGAPTAGAGSAFVLNSDFTVNLFKITRLYFTSSQTIFTNTWNFLHQTSNSFTGSSVNTTKSFKTKRGPLVRGWGDNTPATINDVQVLLDTTPLGIESVNPYTGEIFLEVPVPIFPVGLYTLSVDYKWFKNPHLGLVGLNTNGLNLNTWDRSVGRHTTSNSTSLGVTKTNRFPMGISLGPVNRLNPKEIGHKYIGFQNDYSALLNSQHLLLLNKNPHNISEGNIQANTIKQRALYNGQTLPTNEGWSLQGLDTGYLNNDGTYTLVDASSGSYSIGYESYYFQEVDLSLDTHTTVIGRFKVTDYTLDGIYTGVGVGLYDGSDLGLVGALLINGVQHIGLLLDGSNPQNPGSWKLGFTYTATAISQTVITVPLTNIPNNLKEGQRFVIYNGLQTGIYTVAECGLNSIGDNVLITLLESLPVSINTVGANQFNITYETKWDTDLVTVRMSCLYPEGVLNVYVTSGISGTYLENESLIPYPAQTSLVLPNPDNGIVLWGSTSRKATNESTWDFVQYINNPLKLLQTLQGKQVQLDMNVLPQEESLFYIVGGFGIQSVDSGLLTLNTNSASKTIPTTNYYETVEPFLSTKTKVDVQSTFELVQGTEGVGDIEVYIEDSNRRGCVRSLRYVETTQRGLLVNNAKVSLSGLLSPENDGWTPGLTNSVSTSVVGNTLSFTKTSTQTSTWSISKTPDTNNSGIELEFLLRFNSYTLGTQPLTLYTNVYALGNSKQLYIELTPTSIIVSTMLGTPLLTIPFNNGDGLYHTYKIVCDAIGDVVSVFVDNTLLGTTSYSALLGASNIYTLSMFMGGTSEYSIDLEYMYQTPQVLHPNEKRTLGLLKRDGDINNIDSYTIPRTDNTKALNSSLTAIIKEIDFYNSTDARLLLDPTKGLSLYLPNELMPNGDVYVPGTEEVSNAWAYVEYRNLPVYRTLRSHIGFGSWLSNVISKQKWDSFEYSIKTPNIDYGVAPQGMVLNKAIKLTSGEYNFDTTLEDRTFQTRSSTLIYVPDSGIYGSRVYQVIVDGVVLPLNDYTFNRHTQYIVLDTPLTSSTVRVIFNPGDTISKTYLCTQPIDQTVTVLNSDTPIIPPMSPHYSGVETCTTERGTDVHITSISDNTGFQDIEISGHFVSDHKPVEDGISGVHNKTSSIISGSSSYHTAPALHLSGGSYTGMVLPTNTVSNMLYPNIPGQQMGMNQGTVIHLKDVVYEDSITTPTDNDQADYIITDYGLTTSRLGPWGGVTSLSTSLQGGGVQLSSGLFILNGGQQIIQPSITVGVLS